MFRRSHDTDIVGGLGRDVFWDGMGTIKAQARYEHATDTLHEHYTYLFVSIHIQMGLTY